MTKETDAERQARLEQGEWQRFDCLIAATLVQSVLDQNTTYTPEHVYRTYGDMVQLIRTRGGALNPIPHDKTRS